MAVTHTAWRQYDQGHYVEMSTGETDQFAIDLINELDSGDQLLSATSTADSGITVLSTLVRNDASVRSTPHQMMIVLRATQTGVFHISITSPTINGLTFVKHFDVLVER
jgi:hypothetical protein|tara:strand:- start:315 stop:641 length:327 start_codon:yes stop_codon:yes gene_type:complete